ncbi:hypothetical protein [Polyangium sp. 6x1]|uniref:hypothetical protein n=1 Tax=Polyangium sp. 6x1 TaxID=3042689 RepID=UPI0024821F61|nr:hypothetical protein [Polyangium sp. 6x1]MDI1444858.1 hypothetical protein [Polyangium sp. 6x1]
MASDGWRLSAGPEPLRQSVSRMHASSYQAWNGNDWQDYVVRLLQLRYSIRFQEVPDKHKGDFGVEGFTIDGHAYQCYAAQEPIGTADLYEEQRNKITRDINKFCDNKEDLAKLFGDTKICMWILVVPRHESAMLVQHATKKAEEVRAKNLPYVASDFRIQITTDEAFQQERAVLVTNGARVMRIDGEPVDEDDIDKWSQTHAKLIERLENKIDNIPVLNTDDERSDFRNRQLDHYLRGSSILEKMRAQYPHIYETIDRYIKNKERFVETECLLADTAPQRTIAQVARELEKELSEAIKGIDPVTAKDLAFATIADWLLRCPLRFPKLEGR